MSGFVTDPDLGREGEKRGGGGGGGDGQKRNKQVTM